MRRFCHLRSFALLAALACVACRGQRSRDCEVFVTSVNSVLSEIDRHIMHVDGGEMTNVGDMRRLATLYLTLADRIERMHLSTPELVGESQSYRDMVRTAARAANQVADALAAEDLEKALAAQNQFSAVVEQEDRVVQRINSFCAAQ